MPTRAVWDMRYYARDYSPDASKYNANGPLVPPSSQNPVGHG